jgi:Icc-related predicted phosphoesterase
MLCAAGVTLLDGDTFEIGDVGFVGVKGFGGGFGDRCLEPWGEDATKIFVHESVNESLKLEAALARLKSSRRVAILHYAPIAATLLGEPLEVYAFLGSRRLEEPLIRYPVDAVIHGHAHGGAPEGCTSGGTPVFNVAMPVLARVFPGQPPFRLLEI